jgi:hypothetical protein
LGSILGIPIIGAAMSRDDIAHIADIAEITIVYPPHDGTYTFGEVNELLARQRQIIADRIRKEQP